MSQTAVIFWSGTGNTEAMAKAIYEAIQSQDSNVKLFSVSDIDADSAKAYDKLILGCPSMGAEVLEESEFEPFYTALEAGISGKKIALFGSYGWGDGEWMREWEKRVEQKGAMLFDEGLIINEAPDASGLAECKAFAKRFMGF